MGSLCPFSLNFPILFIFAQSFSCCCFFLSYSFREMCFVYCAWLELTVFQHKRNEKKRWNVPYPQYKVKTINKSSFTAPVLFEEKLELREANKWYQVWEVVVWRVKMMVVNYKLSFIAVFSYAYFQCCSYVEVIMFVISHLSDLFKLMGYNKSIDLCSFLSWDNLDTQQRRVVSSRYYGWIGLGQLNKYCRFNSILFYLARWWRELMQRLLWKFKQNMQFMQNIVSIICGRLNV